VVAPVAASLLGRRSAGLARRRSLRDRRGQVAIERGDPVVERQPVEPRQQVALAEPGEGDLDALERVLDLVAMLKAEGIAIHHLDLGGGLGIRYKNEQPPEPFEYIQAVLARLGNNEFEILMEPGRAIVGNAGILVTQVEYLKPTANKNFAVVDAAMNDLMRPSLYNAWQDIIPVKRKDTTASGHTGEVWDIVGPVCETADFLGKDRMLQIAPGDLLAIRSSGAYGFSMSSNYNSRPRVAELMVDGNQLHLIREKETIEQLWAGERLIP